MNILILEDDEGSRTLLEILLKGEGHTTIALDSVLQAFEHIRKGTIDLILMDIGLPGLDGISFTQKIKKYPKLRHIPIIVITGQPKEFLEGHALRSGCNAYLEKPVNTKELLKLIKKFGGAKSKAAKNSKVVKEEDLE
jgi:CheY-like chemotaxis protein